MPIRSASSAGPRPERPRKHRWAGIRPDRV